MTRPSAASTQSQTDRNPWIILTLGWLLYVAFGVISASLFPLITPIRAELGLSYTEFGFILGIWQLVYIPAAAPVGLLIDHLGTKRSLLLGTLIVASSGLIRSLAVDFATLLGAVALFGLGGPILSVGLPKLIAEWFTGPHRGLASGIYATGSSVGGVVALALTNSVVLPLTGSWRATLQVYAGFALLVAFVWLIAGQSRSAPGHAVASSGANPGVRHLLRHAVVVPVIIIGFGAFLSNHGLRSWLPQIFEAKGLSPADAGLLAAVPTLVGIAGSVLILRLVAVGNRRPATIGLLLATALSTITLAFGDGALMVVGIVVFGFCSGAFMPLLLHTLMEIPEVGSRSMGAAAGLYFSIGEVGGFLGPSVIGILADSTGSFATGLLVLSVVMVILILPALRLVESRHELQAAD